MSSEESGKKQEEILGLPNYIDNNQIEEINLNDKYKFDKLGPIVLNKDGTMSRISNWHEMTKLEQEKTHKMLIKRNKKRRDALLKNNNNNNKMNYKTNNKNLRNIY